MYNETPETFIITGDSYQGIGYALVKKAPNESKDRIINCGSRSLTLAMLNYSVSEI